MISPSETLGPARLLGGALQGVSRLEFLSFELGGAETVVDVVESSEATEIEGALREDVDAAEVMRESQVVEIRAHVEAARREAKAEARIEWKDELEERVLEERASVVRVCDEFGRERAKYFASVESEVVKLALAIAARVLHREAKMDPLLLTAAVQVALGKVVEDSSTVLRVPALDVEMWRGVFGSNDAVQVVGDERMVAEECVLETNVGKVELGVGAQLEEIEKGFFDLLEQRPS
ncbi:flagellar assembly protein FliH [Edaphobacter aggregans]|uniref:Flagellar assembly protein FliH n=1 Tax=Edaphobacter aggregans TaxID=570835 RepID=A0A3R9PWL3_9BACT|nr:FliH/SctL family protein [Edaphobacter aggregans]RSL19456.1 flagellar assembly protein FliH [Edaphobacter aggregans]